MCFRDVAVSGAWYQFYEQKIVTVNHETTYFTSLESEKNQGLKDTSSSLELFLVSL